RGVRVEDLLRIDRRLEERRSGERRVRVEGDRIVAHRSVDDLLDALEDRGRLRPLALLDVALVSGDDVAVVGGGAGGGAGEEETEGDEVREARVHVGR